MGLNSISLQAAVELHLLESGFPADGGINEKWAVVGLGPIPLCLPNTKARRKATVIHDLNHVLSGYDHDAMGEAEIGSWELGGGCKDYWAAWVLNWTALNIGLLKAPGRMLRAFARGRRTGNLYGKDIASMRARPVEEVRQVLGLDRDWPVRVQDVVLFVGVALLSPVGTLITAFAILVTSPMWIAEGAYKKRRIEVH